MTDPYLAADGLVRVYPARDAHGAGLVWLHGGGFAHGDIDMPEADHVARVLAGLGTTVVSVDYRLVHEGCRYPLPVDDVVTAWGWTLAHAPELGVRRFALGGASAGANLAAGAALRMVHDGGQRVPDLMVLAYPTLLAVQPAPPADLRAALDADAQADVFRPDVVREMYEGYLGGPVDPAPVYAAPGLATPEQLAEYPATLMVNGEIDELRVSGEVFAATLRAAGRDIEELIEPGTGHGHLNRPHEPESAITLHRFATRLRALAEG